MTAVRPAPSDDPGPEPDASALADPARVAAAGLLIAAGPLSASTQRLVDLTAALLGTSYAQLSLLADEQVIALSHGLDLSLDERVSPLEESVCTYTVALGELLAIDDAPHHPWVATLPPVLDGTVGSYIGVPLFDQRGLALGALCAYDPAPRFWTETDRITMRTLAAAVQDELAVPVPAPAAITGADELRTGVALSAADIGSFELNAVTHELVGDARFAGFFGLSASGGSDQLDSYLARIHEDDRDRIVRELDSAIERRSDYFAEHRVTLPDGEVRWLSVRGRVFADILGRPTRLSGIAYDTTVLRQSRDQLARLLETMTDAFFRLDRQWMFSYVNAEAERILGRGQGDLVGRYIWDAFPEAVGSQSQQQYERAVRTGVPISFEDYFAPLDMWYEVRATPDADGLSVFFHDVSDRKRAEYQRESANGRLALLAEATSMMAATLDADVALERLAAMLVPSFADWVVISQVDEDGTVRPAGFRHHEGREEEMAAFVAANAAALPPDSLTARVLAGGPPTLLQAMDEKLVKVAPGNDFPELMAQLAEASFMVVPLIARGRVLGTIGLIATLPRWFLEEDLEVATDLGRRAGMSLDNARLYAQARTAQALAESSTARLSLIAEVTRSMNSTLDADEAMRRLISLVVSRMADWAVVTLRDDEGRMVDALARHRDAGRSDLADRFAATHIGLPHESSYVAEVARTGEPLLVRHAAPGREASVNERAELPLTELGLASLLVLPLVARDRILGVLVLGRDENSARFSEADLATAADLARRAGLSLENAQLYSRQRRAAEVLQRSLLTRLPEPDHLEVVARYLPAAEEAQVGGDWYDAFLQPDGATVLAIGDVVGHDMGAAAAMGQLRNLLRGTAYDREDTPAHTLSRVDAAIRGLQVDTLATAVIGRIEQTAEDRAAGRRTVRWSNAGHPPPMLLSADGKVTVLDPEADLLLGLDPHTERNDHQVVLHDGSTLLFYTDGLVERRDSPLDAGLARLRQALSALADQPLESLCDELLARLLPGEADDDVALVAVRAHPEDRPRPADIAPVNVPDLVRADLDGHSVSATDREPAPVAPHVAHLHLHGDPTDVARARRFLRTTATVWQVRHESIDTAVLVLSEVVTNAIRYAPGPVDITMTHSAGVLRIDVADNAHDLGPRRPPATVEQLRVDAEGGRGLFLVESLSQRWGTTPIAGDGKLVWFEIAV